MRRRRSGGRGTPRRRATTPTSTRAAAAPSTLPPPAAAPTPPSRRFERNPDGNGPDCSGFYPGEARYKDPKRPFVDFAASVAEREAMAEIDANKKAGDVPGAPGCYN